MSAIRMNAWVFEKAGNLARVAIRLRELAALLPELQREELESKAWQVYFGGIIFTAYASGEFPEHLQVTAYRAFTEGPGQWMPWCVSLLPVWASTEAGTCPTLSITTTWWPSRWHAKKAVK